MSPFAALRAACAELLADARFVEIDDDRLRALAERARDAAPPVWDAATHYAGEDDALLAYVFALDALNFGSGWFPLLRKREGRSGYYTQCMGLKEVFERRGPTTADELRGVDAAQIAKLLGQRGREAELAEFLDLQARALRDLGTLVALEYGGSFAALRDAAGDSAAALVRLLARMPLFRDVARSAYGLELPFYKRAQIAVSDLALAFGGRGYGAFADLAELTAFADNTVPHVLRCEGVLRYAPGLAAAIEAGEELANGCPEEIEIRAAAVECVERMGRHLAGGGDSIAPREIDAWLWTRGQDVVFKARPRHRTRCAFY